MGVLWRDEIERKYEVDEATIVPPLVDIPGVSAIRQPVELDLAAVYFDTDTLDLSRQGTTLRRRTGGEDAGWHLKVSEGNDTRTELQAPLTGDSEAVPAELLEPVRAVVRDRALAPIARVLTRRRQSDLVGEDDVVLAQVCDDEVRAERLRSPSQVQQWRELEVELVDGTPPLLDAVEERLVAVGASRSPDASKLARTLADAFPETSDRPSPKQLSRGTAAQLVLDRLEEQSARLHRQDAALRAGHPSSIHKLRIAVRRLRSTLTTYRPVFAPGSVTGVNQELRWLGRALGEARDAQVLREHLDQVVAAEPAELVLGPVASRIDDDLRAAFRVGREHALAALDSERYFRLLDEIDALVRSPSLAPEADAPATDVLPNLLQRDGKRLRRAVRETAQVDDRAERDRSLHEARKKAKRLRYAAESAVPVFGDRAKALAASAKRVQEALGAHQDAVNAREKLRQYGVQAHLDGENAFTFGRLHGLEQARADKAERRFRAAWEDLPRKRLHRWIQE